jgi:hypothetical protein
MTENNDDYNEKTITYVYIPDDGIYGTIISHGVWSSMVEYYYGGIKYVTEVENDEFIVIDEIGLGYVDETGEDL